VTKRRTLYLANPCGLSVQQREGSLAALVRADNSTGLFATGTSCLALV